MTQLAQQMTYAAFSAAADCQKLEQHGRDWEIFLAGQSLGFADGTMAQALRQAHEREVNNALYANSVDAPAWMTAALPTAEVLREYPQVVEKFPDLARRVFRETPMHAGDHYDGLRTFADVRAMAETLTSHKDLVALNDAVEERFMRDQPALAMTDADWTEWTALVARQAAALDGGARSGTERGAVSAFLQANREAYREVAVDTARGDYSGPFVFVNEGYAVQALGRGAVAVHALHGWPAKPACGQYGAVRYRDGATSITLKEPGRERGRGGGLTHG